MLMKVMIVIMMEINHNEYLMINHSHKNNNYYENLPDSLKARVIIVDINKKDWFFNAINKAETLLKEPFSPCKKALNLFDQDQTFNEMAKVIFK